MLWSTTQLRLERKKHVQTAEPGYVDSKKLKNDLDTGGWMSSDPVQRTRTSRRKVWKAYFLYASINKIYYGDRQLEAANNRGWLSVHEQTMRRS